EASTVNGQRSTGTAPRGGGPRACTARSGEGPRGAGALGGRAGHRAGRRAGRRGRRDHHHRYAHLQRVPRHAGDRGGDRGGARGRRLSRGRDRKSTRLNSSHVAISYAVFCLKKKKTEYKDGTLAASSTGATTGSASIHPGSRT